jgi:putative phosphoesterase
MTHGHLCSVSYGTQELARQALGNECDIAIFGHTHRPKIDDSSERLLILNPGSITFPRQEMRKRSYMILKLEKGKRPEAELRYV